jgi:predicted lipid carrier protein YhbT
MTARSNNSESGLISFAARSGAYLHVPLLPLRLVPACLHGMVLERLLGLSLASQEADGELDFLQDRRLRIRIEDIGLDWLITHEGHRWRVLNRHLSADATITGKVRDLVLLASRREDPDTLFFQRRLVIEGDVEFGLQAKNLLDSMEWEALPPPLRWLLEQAGQLAS